MAIQSKSQIKAWFKKNCYPTEGQFADTWDSFWHKAEQITLPSIAGLTDILNSKQDKTTATVTDVSEIGVFDPDKVGGYLAGNTFVSFKNLASSNTAFHTASIYHCVLDAAIGESPETHIAKWEDQGTTITYTSSSTCTTHVVLGSELAKLTGMKNGDVVGVQADGWYYKYNLVGGWTRFATFIWDLKQSIGTSQIAVMSQKAVTDLVGLKVDKVAGKSLISDTEIARLAGINDHLRGSYLTKAALDLAVPVANAGDEATVDSGVGSDPIKYIWDTSDNSWKQGGGGGSVTVDQTVIQGSTGAVSGGAVYNALLNIPTEKEYQVSTFGQLTCLISFIQNEKIVSIPTKRNVDTLKLTPIAGGADIILITAGNVTSILPINIALGDYTLSLSYAIGTSTSLIVLKTQKQ